VESELWQRRNINPDSSIRVTTRVSLRAESYKEAPNMDKELDSIIATAANDEV